MKSVENFIDQIVSTGMETIDKPGFIICKVTNSNKPLFLRELILPEDAFVSLETNVKRKFGQKGLLALYTAGKNFGYNYSKISDFVKYDKKIEKEFVEFFDFFMNYFKSWWLSDYKYEFNFEKKYTKIEFWDYLVCRKNGIGKILNEGSMAGFFSYLFNDETIEAKHISCQGNGAKTCKTIYAPARDLKIKPVKITKQEYDEEVYNQLNSTKEIKYSKSSFKDLMYSKFVKYDLGVLTVHDFRYFLIGSDFIYDIEKEMEKLDDGKLLYVTTKNFGKKLAKASKRDLTENLEFLSAFGWGDFFVQTENDKFLITLINYPWFEQINKHECKFMSGLLSGIISEIKGKNVDFKVFKKDISDRADVILREI